MIKEVITKLVEGLEVSREEAHASMQDIMSGGATEAQIGSFITALRMVGETPEMIAGCAQAMRENFTAVDAGSDIVVDTCGTGGDKAHTFNISTAAAIVTAGAGITVAKHGNKSVSSQCGSADVLSALGVNIQIPAEQMEACLKSIKLAFLFAPALHPAMKYAIGPRREIGIRTIFNILGPLSNPAGARYGVLGVYDQALVPMLAEAAAALGARRLFVVHGMDGLDEITTTTKSTIGEIREGNVEVYELNPEELGIALAAAEELRGGEPAENAEIIHKILDGETGPKRDIVVLNSAAAILAGQKADSWEQAIKAAQTSIDSGAAKEKLQSLVHATQAASS